LGLRNLAGFNKDAGGENRTLTALLLANASLAAATAGAFLPRWRRA
jgi:hypothetical protein